MDAPAEVSVPLYPIIKLRAPNLPKQDDLFEPKRGAASPREVDFVEVAGPVSDDVVPIIFGYDHDGVYVRRDVADHLRVYLTRSQRLTRVLCEGVEIPYFALRETAPEVWLPENWIYIPSEERMAPEFHDGSTTISIVFPNAFRTRRGVHFVGNYMNVLLDITVWASLRRAIPSVTRWLTTSRIVTEDGRPDDQNT